MDSEGEANAPSPPASGEQHRNAQVDNAIRAIQDKKPVPEIDFTIHTMEDNTQVNTMERVCKGA
jgi:serine/threonine-protein phosphatase 2B catalytic subunit